jgi:dTMP kinase
LEGIDGSGKSTQAQLLADWLRELGSTVVLTREPGGTALAEQLRHILLDPAVRCSSRAELLMMLAARAEHVAEIIAPALQTGTTVVSDRFSLSSLAYQGLGRGIPLAEIYAADAVATAGVRPTLTIVVDIPLDLALQRVGEKRDRFEGEGREFWQRVIDGYRQLAAQEASVRVVDGARTIAEVQATIRQEIQPLLRA